MQTAYAYELCVWQGPRKCECLSPLGPLASMADVSAAGIELPNGVTVAISSPMLLCAIYM